MFKKGDLVKVTKGIYKNSIFRIGAITGIFNYCTLIINYSDCPEGWKHCNLDERDKTVPCFSNEELAKVCPFCLEQYCLTLRKK